MAPKAQPRTPKASFVSVLAAGAALFAVSMIGVPMLVDWYGFHNPKSGRIAFNLNPAACKALLNNEQSSTEPCEITSPYAFDPVKRELVLFLSEEDVHVPTWREDVVTISGEPVRDSVLPFAVR